MPDPIMDPATIIVESNSPSPRTNCESLFSVTIFSIIFPVVELEKSVPLALARLIFQKVKFARSH